MNAAGSVWVGRGAENNQTPEVFRGPTEREKSGDLGGRLFGS